MQIHSTFSIQIHSMFSMQLPGLQHSRGVSSATYTRSDRALMTRHSSDAANSCVEGRNMVAGLRVNKLTAGASVDVAWSAKESKLFNE